MKFEVKFPKGFPEVGDLIRFTCSKLGAARPTRKYFASTVEATVVARNYDGATGLHYLIVSDDNFRHICNDGDGWQSYGIVFSSLGGDMRVFHEHRTHIYNLKVVRKHR